MKKILPLIFVFTISNHVIGQITSVDFDVITNQINSGVPLPSEEPFYIKGTLPTNIKFVKVKVNRPGKSNKQAEEYVWKTAFDFQVSKYELFISTPLKSNTDYNLEFSYYQKASEEQMDEVKSALNKNLESYINANLEVASAGIKSYSNDQVMISQMNQIVANGLLDYRHFLGRDFPGFSDLVKQKLNQKDKLKLRRARFNILGRDAEANEKQSMQTHILTN